MSPQTTSPTDLAFFASLFQSIAADLAMIMDTEVKIGEPAVERAKARASGEGQVHVSFRFLVNHEGEDHHGSVLVPLPDAITLAAHLMMMDAKEIEEARRRTDLDRPLKEAMIEVGNFIAGAVDAVIRTWYPSSAACRSVGCQGVRAGVRPALEYTEGDPMAVARAGARIGRHASFSILVQLPPPPAE